MLSSVKGTMGWSVGAFEGPDFGFPTATIPSNTGDAAMRIWLKQWKWTPSQLSRIRSPADPSNGDDAGRVDLADVEGQVIVSINGPGRLGGRRQRLL